MNKLLKNQNGIAAVVIILIVIVGVVAGGATILGVRAIVTGESYLAPFEDLGWISSDDDDEDEEDSKIDTLVDSSRLSNESRSSETVQYYGSIDMATSEGMSASDEDYDLYKTLAIEVNMFAKDNKVVEIVFHIDFETFLKKFYEEYGDEFEEEGYEYDDYNEFEEEWLPAFQDAIEDGLYSADESIEDYIQVYHDGAITEMYITESGFEALYETYDIEEGTDDVDAFIESFEDAMDIKMEKV